jgi:hypothetical protein
LTIKYPIEYELALEEIDPGRHWVTLKLKNIGTEPLHNLDVGLNSMDSLNLSVTGTGQYVSVLRPDEEELLPFQVDATRTSDLYATVSGPQDGEPFYWESPTVTLNVGGEAAEIQSLFVLTHPHAPIGENLEVEATLRGITGEDGLSLEFWVDTPTGDFKQLGRIGTKSLSTGETAIYSTEVTPKDEGWEQS